LPLLVLHSLAIHHVQQCCSLRYSVTVPVTVGRSIERKRHCERLTSVAHRLRHHQAHFPASSLPHCLIAPLSEAISGSFPLKKSHQSLAVSLSQERNQRLIEELPARRQRGEPRCQLAQRGGCRIRVTPHLGIRRGGGDMASVAAPTPALQVRLSPWYPLQGESSAYCEECT